MGRAEIKRYAKSVFKEQWSTILLILVLTIPAYGIAMLFGFGVGKMVVAGPITFGLYYVCMKAAKGEKTDWKEMFMGFRERFADSFIAGLIMLICEGFAIAGIVAFIVEFVISVPMLVINSYWGISASFAVGVIFNLLWTAALAVVGILLYLAFALAPIVLLKEPETRGMDALKKSKALMTGEKGGLFVFYLSYIGWGILCGMTCGLLYIYVGPYFWTAKTMYLEQIYDKKHGQGNGYFRQPEQPAPANNYSPYNYYDDEPTAMPGENFAGENRPKYCGHCGAVIPDGAAFCGKCGTPQR